MLNTEPPDRFQPWFEIVSCYCWYDNKILLLHRLDHKSEGGKWGPPAGKRNSSETLERAMARELFEETGIVMAEKEFQPQKSLYVRYPNKDFVYHTFELQLSHLPKVVLADNEHQNFRWVTLTEAKELPLVQDELESMRLTFKL